MKRLFAVAAILFCTILTLSQPGHSEIVTTTSFKPASTLQAVKPDGYPVAVFAGGCFWCVESEFRRIEGVLYTRSGYSGGSEKNPTYDQVSSHQTGHREAVEVTFDPKKVSYKDLTDFFMTRAHDPTQEDGQGPDIGLQYTSAIFYLDDDQKETAQSLIKTYTDTKRFKKPIATKVLPFSAFYPAEDYHQQYYEKSQAKTGEMPMNLWLRQQRENAGKLFSGE